MKVGTAERRRRQLSTLCAAALVASVLVQVVGLPPAGAASTVGMFEIDGDRADNPNDPAIDWTSPPPNLSAFTDGVGNKDQDGFTNGSKETAPGQWQCGPSSAPQKADITAGEVAFRTLDDKQFVYVDFTRKAQTGDVHIDFEFSQLAPPATATCPTVPRRKSGDIILAFDGNGGTDLLARAFRWTYDAGSTTTGSFTELGLGSKGVTWDAVAAGTFGEGVLNLTDTIGTIACGKFSGAYIKSRSSESIDSALQDFTRSQPIKLGRCPKSDIVKGVRNFTQNPSGAFGATTTAVPGEILEYQLTYTNSGEVPATNVVLADMIQPRQTYLSCSNSCTPNGPPTTSVAWNLASVPAGGTQVVTFRVTLDPTFPAGATTITNQATAKASEDENPTSSNTTTATVNAAPSTTRTKTVSPNPADVGQVVTYTITYTNAGTAPDTVSPVDDYDQAHLSVDNGSITHGGTNNGDTISWTNLTVPAKGTLVLTYSGTVIGPFSGPLGPLPCTSLQYKVLNNVADYLGSFSSTLCVNAGPILHISKTACPAASVVPGGLLTYEIRFGNTGTAAANDVVVVDTIPPGTQVVDSGDGAVSGSTVTYNVRSLAIGQTLTRRLTVLVGADNGALLTNTASISASNVVDAVSTQPVNTAVSNVGAVTNGNAYGVDTTAHDLALLTRLGEVSTTAPGSPQNAFVSALLPAVGVPGVINLDTVTQTSSSQVGSSSSSLSTSTAIDLDLLGGAIHADVVRGVSSSLANATAATPSSIGSTFANLRINGASLTNVAPNTTVRVKDALGHQTVAEVKLYEETKTATFTNARFTATHSVNMIHVTMLRSYLGLTKGAEIIVGHAQTSATYPSGLACDTSPNMVSGEAYTIDAEGSFDGADLLSGREGDAVIGPLGGSDSDTVSTTSVVPAGTVATAANTTSGSISPSPSSTARSVLSGVNILSGLVTADLLDVQSTSTTTATSASTAMSATFVNLMVNGQPVAAAITPNTVITVKLPNEMTAVIILNERIPGGDGTKHTEGTVNAIHVQIFDQAGLLRADLVVASAHSGAHRA